MMDDAIAIPDPVTGIRLCKIKQGALILCRPVFLVGGAAAVATVLRRASISGAVGPVGETGDFWADLMTEDGSWIETIALSCAAWNSIKTRWARTTIDSEDAVTK